MRRPPSNAARQADGGALRATRLEIGWTLEEAARHLHLAPTVVAALESDDWSAVDIPPVYVDGYRRNYARLLNVRVTTPRRRPLHLRGVGGRRLRRGISGVAVVAAAALLVVVCAAAFYYVRDGGAPGVGPSTAAAWAPQSTAPAVAVAAAMPNGRLRLRYRDRSWTQVEDGIGRVLIKRDVDAGAVQTLEGTPPFRVTLGSAAAVEVEYDDRPFDHLNYINDDNIARFTLGASKPPHAARPHD